MNERIKKLAEQAAFRQFTMPKTASLGMSKPNASSFLADYNGMFTEQEAIQKFAELIVRDVVNYYRSQLGETSEPHTKTLEYFGVE